MTVLSFLALAARVAIAFLPRPLRVARISSPTLPSRSGGLISYGPNIPDLWRRSADYVDKILHGAKPADSICLDLINFEDRGGVIDIAHDCQPAQRGKNFA